MFQTSFKEKIFNYSFFLNYTTRAHVPRYETETRYDDNLHLKSCDHLWLEHGHPHTYTHTRSHNKHIDQILDLDTFSQTTQTTRSCPIFFHPYPEAKLQSQMKKKSKIKAKTLFFHFFSFQPIWKTRAQKQTINLIVWFEGFLISKNKNNIKSLTNYCEIDLIAG